MQTTDPTQGDYYDKAELRTPPKMVAELQDYFGEFRCDLAATADNTICGNFFTRQRSAFEHEWPDGLLFANPPYNPAGTLTLWTSEIVKRRAEAVILVPSKTEAVWFQDFVLAHAQVYTVRGRIVFCYPDGTPCPGGGRFGNVVAYYGPKATPGWNNEKVFVANNWK